MERPPPPSALTGRRARRRFRVAPWTALLAVACACGSLKSAPTGESAAADAGIDDGGARSPVGVADGGREAGTDARLDAGEACAEPCAGRACGKDPLCDASCGECAAAEACAETDASAACAPATIVWELDGVVVTKFATHEAFYAASTGTYSLYFNYYGRNVGLTFTADAGAGTVTRCPTGGPASLTLLTADNGWAKLDPLPAAWRNLIFISCGAQSTGDAVLVREATIDSASPTRIVGRYDIVVEGAGPRAGSTLRVHGEFDATPQAL